MNCPKCGQELRTLSVGVFCDNCGPLEFGMDVRAKIEKAEAKVAELEAQKEKIKAETLDRVEAELPTFRFYCRYYSDLTDDMVGCIANENGHCNNDECKALSEVKKAISKIRGLEK